MELYIGFSEVLQYFRKHLKTMIPVILLFGIVSGLLPLKYVHHIYTGDTTVIVSCEIPEDASSDYRLQYTNILNSRVQTAVALAAGPDLIDKTAGKLGIDKTLISKISAIQVNSAPVVKLTAETTDADLAAKISDTAAEILSEKITNAFPSPKITAVVSDKSEPATPQSRKSAMVKGGILGLAVGLIVCVCFGILAVLSDRTVRNGRYVEEALGGKLLAELPEGDGPAREDSCRRLRAAALRQAEASSGGSFLVADVGEKNGAETVAAGFASALAQSGGRTLLIDADLRSPRIAGIFHASPEGSVSDVLGGSRLFDGAVVKSSVKGLDLLVSAAPAKEDAADLLAGKGFAALMSEAAGKYDYVVVHAPSEIHYPEADVIAGTAGSVILTVKYGSTPYADMKESYRRVSTSGGKIVGFAATGA